MPQRMKSTHETVNLNCERRTTMAHIRKRKYLTIIILPGIADWDGSLRTARIPGLFLVRLLPSYLQSIVREWNNLKVEIVITLEPILFIHINFKEWILYLGVLWIVTRAWVVHLIVGILLLMLPTMFVQTCFLFCEYAILFNECNFIAHIQLF